MEAKELLGLTKFELLTKINELEAQLQVEERISDGYCEQRDEYLSKMQILKSQNKELREELEAALEYWNQDRNNQAMFDALCNYEKIIDQILTSNK